jgi:prepilin-type N-terminal cleavage/methylation domain-containing protein
MKALKHKNTKTRKQKNKGRFKGFPFSCFRERRGFTVVEMLVSITVFTVIMTIAVGSVVSVLGSNREAQAVQLVMNNINFVLENMTRNIRTGGMYHCDISQGTAIDTPRSCVTGASSLAFEESFGDRTTASDQWVYKLEANSIQRSVDGGINFEPITAPEVSIQKLVFYVLGTDSYPTDLEQPKVVIVLQGKAEAQTGREIAFNLQTTVAQRMLDL